MSTNEQKQSQEKFEADSNILQRLLDYELPGASMQNDQKYAPRLLDRLRQLGIIQVADKWRCVFFYTTHNTRPLLMFQIGEKEFPQYERLHPFYVYETVNRLMWERLLEPELALAYKGLFDWVHIPGFAFILSHDLSDSAFDHMYTYFNDEDI